MICVNKKDEYFLSKFAKQCKKIINKEILLQMKETIRNKKLNIRMTSSEKNRISKKAEKLDMSVSDYSRMILLSQDRNRTAANVLMSNMLVKSQELVNYIQDSYGNDKKLERMIEGLWEIN